MLKQRILTAVILGPLILWSVVVFSHRALAIELGLFLAIAAWEWARLSGIENQFGRVAYGVLVSIGMLALTGLMHARIDLLQSILVGVVACWFVASIVIIVFDRSNKTQAQVMSATNISLNLATGLVILLGAFIAITGLHQASQYGYPFILILLALIWIADSAAYFSGKAFGKHKLAPHVSPGKTWEGVFGAVLATLITAFIITRYREYTSDKTVSFLVIALVTMTISIVGDLLVSLFKRRAGVKDSSQLLPGHGGILDRLDSLIAAAPVFLLGMLLAGLE